MAARAKPYDLRGAPTVRTVEEIDEMFAMLFRDLAAGAPGSNRSIVFNNQGSLAGTSGLFWDPIYKILGFGTERSASVPGLKRDGTSIQVRLADDSGFADLRVRLGEYGLTTSTAATLVVNGGASGGAMIQMRRTVGVTQNVSFRISTGGLTIVDDTTANIVASALGDASVNQLYMGIRGSSTANTRPSLINGTTHTSAAGTDVAGQDLRIGAGRGTGAGTPGDLDFQTGTAGASGTTAQSATSRWKIRGTSGNLDAQAGTELIRWGTTASFPALKRSSTDLQVRLGNDSGYTALDASGFKAGGVAGVTDTFQTADEDITVTGGIITDISSGGTGGGTLAREDVADATASIATGATDSGEWDIGYSVAQLLKIASDAGGQLVLYASDAARTNDARTFPLTDDPDPGTGVLGDFIFGAGGGEILVSPPVLLYNDEATPTTELFYKFYRTEAGTDVANVTLTILGLEA